MRYNGRDKYWAQHEVNMPAGGGSVDRAPDSQRTNASSKLEKEQTFFYHNIHTYTDTQYITVHKQQSFIRTLCLYLKDLVKN